MVDYLKMVLTMIVLSGDAQESPTLLVNITGSNPLTCESIETIFLDNQTAYIVFHTDKSLNIKNEKFTCKSLQFSRILNINLTSKDKNYLQYTIKAVQPDMHGRWECTGSSKNDHCNIDIRVRSRGLWTVKINTVVLEVINQVSPQSYKWIAQYDFYENELAEVECGNSDKGEMAFKVEGENSSFTMANTTFINMLMRLRMKNAKYIDCYHNISGLVSVVRIALKPKEMDLTEDTRITVDGQVWSPRPSYLDYKYIEGEKLSVSCEEITQNKDSTDDYVSIGQRNTCSNGNIVQTTALDIKGIQGLRSSNIIFWFTNSTNYLEIHYEYEDDETLNFTWIHPHGDAKKYKCLVSWKGAKQHSKLYNGKCIVRRPLAPVTPSEDDDRTVIKFEKSSDKRGILSIKIVLHRIVTGGDLDPIPDKINGNQDMYTFYIPAGVLCLIFVFIVTYFILYKKRKTANYINRVHANVAEDNNYEHLYEEIDIPPFPPQWDTYATIMDRTEPDLKSIQDLYTKPIPKSERMPKLNDTYSTVVGASIIDDDEILYHEIQFKSEP